MYSFSIRQFVRLYSGVEQIQGLQVFVFGLNIIYDPLVFEGGGVINTMPTWGRNPARNLYSQADKEDLMMFNLSKLRIPFDDILQNKSTGVSAQGPKICWFLSISFLVVVVAAAAAVVMVDGRQSLCNSFPSSREREFSTI